MCPAGWWAPLPRPPRNVSDQSRDGFVPYFELANMQSTWLGSMWQEEHWLVCGLGRLNASLAAVGSVLGIDRARPPAPLQLGHAHALSNWAPRYSLERTIRWAELRRYALLDEALYEKVRAAGGCLAHSSDASLRARLEPLVAPAVWV